LLQDIDQKVEGSHDVGKGHGPPPPALIVTLLLAMQLLNKARKNTRVLYKTTALHGQCIFVVFFEVVIGYK